VAAVTSTILVVDDEPIVRDVIVRYRARDGFATLEAGDGEEARRLIETASPSGSSSATS
jgi:CheY-like chemotaxis protein